MKMSFQFGTAQQTPAQPSTGFSFNQPGQTQQPASTFAFSTPQSQPSAGFSFNTATPSFSFGGAQATSTPANPAPAFGTFGTPSTGFGTPATTSAGLSFGAPTPTPSTFGGFNQLQPQPQPTAALPIQPSFGQPTALNTGLGGNPGFGGFGAPVATTPAMGSFSFAAATPSAAPSMPTFGVTTSVAPATGGTFSFGATPTTTAQTGFGFGSTFPATANTGIGFGVTTPAATSQFGAPAPAVQPSQFGAPAPAAQPSQFGAPAPAPATQPAPFGLSTNLPAFASIAPQFSSAPQTSTITTPAFAAPLPPSTTQFALPSGKPLFGLPVAQPTLQPTTAAAVAPFSFNSAPISSTFSFGATTTPVAPSTITTAAPPVAPTAAPLGGLNFGATPAATTTSASGLTFFQQPPKVAATTSTVSSGFGPTPSLGLGTQVSTAATGLTFGPGTTLATSTAAPTVTAKPTGLAFMTQQPTATTTTTPGFGLGATTTPSTATPGLEGTLFATPKAPDSTTSTTSTIVSTSATSIAPSFGASLSLTSTAAVATATSTASVTDSLTTPNMSFRQLEEAINKWNLELSEQERAFLSQATQVNAWDRLLISNGEKITGLNEAVEKVKMDQQHLDQELDFIVAQQRELEELLVPLEKSVEVTPSLSIQQHADLEREHTYHMAENIDGQLKRMSEDIKKIIDHLNTASKNQDENDPMYQISKILNAHMDALQWIDKSTESLQKKLDDVSKVFEATSKDQEKGSRLIFD